MRFDCAFGEAVLTRSRTVIRPISRENSFIFGAGNLGWLHGVSAGLTAHPESPGRGQGTGFGARVFPLPNA